MNIIISNSSGRPIYEQITSQIKNMIITGILQPGTPLPSMRILAKELHISVITTKRAYNDLEQEGFIETVTGKGSFVAKRDAALIRESSLRMAEESLARAVGIAQENCITLEELQEMLKVLYEGD